MKPTVFPHPVEQSGGRIDRLGEGQGLRAQGSRGQKNRRGQKKTHQERSAFSFHGDPPHQQSKLKTCIYLYPAIIVPDFRRLVKNFSLNDRKSFICGAGSIHKKTSLILSRPGGSFNVILLSLSIYSISVSPVIW
jgi:hypothetical protein